MVGPIEGLRVVDCSLGTAGPRATGMLADYGADVVWVEPPGGDPLRAGAPAAVSVLDRGKRSVELDVRDASAVKQLLALTDRAEVFVESWRPGVADRLGLGYEVLHARDPGLVYVSVSGFGEDDDDLPGYEPIVQAVLGSMSDQSAHRDGPVYLGFPFASIGAASLAVIGGLAALRRAARRRLRSPRPDLIARRRARLPLHVVGRERRVDRVERRATLAPVDRQDATRDALVRMR